MPTYHIPTFFAFIFLITLGQINLLIAQDTTLNQKLILNGDFRFRVEHDWASHRADGTFRADRSRLRFRTRFGANYQYNDWASFGLRIRTGNLNDQQGPHLTLGGNGGEFSTLQIGVEKAFFKVKNKYLSAWLGKNKFPFKKQNELFWNDNVYPEGLAAHWKIPIKPNFIDALEIRVAHFILNSQNQTFDKDNYLQGVQLLSKHWNQRINFFPTFYYFNQVPNLPDGKGTQAMAYKIVHLGGQVEILKKPKFLLGIDYYHNLEVQFSTEFEQDKWENQNQGFVFSLKLGTVKKKGDWLLHLYYAYIEKYAVVDYLAQNDWARWDYSGQDATGSRLSNFQGIEARIGYALGKNFNLILRAYRVEQLLRLGAAKETGNRIRLDLNIGF